VKIFENLLGVVLKISIPLVYKEVLLSLIVDLLILA